ncbi:MAG: hypothetical protein RL095_1607 [Verrucomicrobiota bacterium]|jgi:acyl carrier protein
MFFGLMVAAGLIFLAAVIFLDTRKTEHVPVRPRKTQKKNGRNLRSSSLKSVTIKDLVFQIVTDEAEKIGILIAPDDMQLNCRLMADFGMDILTIAEIIYQLEKELNVRLKFSDDEAEQIKLGDLIEISAGISNKISGLNNSWKKKQVAPSVYYEVKNILQCQSCKNSSEYPLSSGEVNCKSCGSIFFNPGLLPDPLSDLPIGSAVSKLKIPSIPRNLDLEQIPEWVCSCCCGPFGLQKKCSRCGCIFEKCPPANLHARIAGLGDFERGNFYRQFTVFGRVSLCRIRRMSPQEVLEIGGTDELAMEMLPFTVPTGVMEQPASSSNQSA